MSASGVMAGGVIALLVVWAVRAGHAAARADWGRAWLNVLDGWVRLYCHRWHRQPATLIPLPDVGPALVVSNHVSGLDPLLLIAASQRPLRFMIACEQYERFGLNWLYRAVGCIPVDRVHDPRLAVRHATRALMTGEVVALFPEGGINRRRRARQRPLKSGVMRLAQFSGAPVFPVRITGVRAPGHALWALLPRSRAQINVLPELPPEAFRTDLGLWQLAAQILDQPLEMPGPGTISPAS